MNLSPTAERVELLDVLRGIAIFGMFTVNMTADADWADEFTELAPGSIDFMSLVFVNLFTNGKFITIFSFLFGIGFFVQSQRQIEKNRNVISFWFRRMSGLLIIGLVANACTIPAWILVDYAIFGLGLLLFYRLSPRNILLAALACLLIGTISGSILPAYWPSPGAGIPAGQSVLDVIHAAANLIHSDGSFMEISALTILHLWEELTDWRYYLGDLGILGLMLLGLYVGRLGAVWNREVQVTLARKHVPWLLGVGFLGCAVWVAMSMFGLGDESSVHHAVVSDIFAWPVGMPVLGLGYAAAITLLMDSERWRSRLIVFAPIGRMALTNYLITGFLAAFIEFQWGLGLYGEVSPATGLLIVVGLLPLQMLFSRWWLNSFAFGPFEWLWRYWTYAQPPTMRRRSSKA